MTEPLTEWLRLMLDEIARKRLDSERAAAERRTRGEEAERSRAAREPVAGHDRIATGS